MSHVPVAQGATQLTAYVTLLRAKVIERDDRQQQQRYM
jgi:hypothetical protein